MIFELTALTYHITIYKPEQFFQIASNNLLRHTCFLSQPKALPRFDGHFRQLADCFELCNIPACIALWQAGIHYYLLIMLNNL